MDYNKHMKKLRRNTAIATAKELGIKVTAKTKTETILKKIAAKKAAANKK